MPPMPEDSELLWRFVAGSERAFTELVQRHVNLVYACALRRVSGDAQAAEDVTQAVFLRCAQKAAALQHHPALAGWLHRATRYVAIDVLRGQRRRLRAEEALAMQSESVSAAERDAVWTEIRPVIDAVLDRLPERDRNAIVWRFFEGLSLASVGARLQVSEDAARMRIDRALDRVRRALARRGVQSTRALLGAALVESATVTAPAGLAATISVGSVNAGSASAAALGTLLLMNKAQGLVVGAVLAAGVMGAWVESRAVAGATAQLAAARPTTRSVAAAAPVPAAADGSAGAELARLRARIAELKSRPAGVVEADMIPRSEWRYVGYATPQAALETFLWASTTGAYDQLAQSFVFGDSTKRRADAFFDALPESVRAVYGTPERMYAPYVFSLPSGARAGADRVDAIEPLDVIPGTFPNEVRMRYWVRRSDGSQHTTELPFERVGGRWLMGGRTIGAVLPAGAKFRDAVIAAAMSGDAPVSR